MTPGSLPNFKTCSLIAAVAAALAIAFVVAIVATPAAQAQTFQVIHAFTGGEDGGNPEAGLTVDAAGNFYGTTEFGNQSAGTGFKLVHSRFGWVLTTLYSFGGGNGGSSPWGRVAIASGGTLYGTTTGGGGGNCQPLGCGTVFQLTPRRPHLQHWAAPAHGMKHRFMPSTGVTDAILPTTSPSTHQGISMAQHTQAVP